MKILLVRPVSTKMPIMIPNLGLGYLASRLRDHGYGVTILDCAKLRFSYDDFRTYLLAHSFDVVGVQIYTCDLMSARKMIDIARGVNRHIVTIAGGPHVSALPDHTLNTVPNLDYCFCGEAEVGLVRFCDYLSGRDGVAIEEIPGLVYRQEGDVRRNRAEIVTDLDTLAFPSWDLISPKSYPAATHGTFTKRLPVAPIITSRGCQYECTYCGVKTNTGRRLRMRSPDNIIKEIELLITEYHVREIHIEDDNFTADRKRIVDFCNGLIARKIDICWACPNGVRLDTLDAELLQLMERAGCYSVAVGIESGSAHILRDMNRKMTVETLKEKVNLIAAATGIRMTGFAMAGYPTETLADVEATINLTLSLPINRVQYSNFLPLPGTRIFEELLERGEISLDRLDWDSFQNNRIVYSPPGITPEQLHKAMKKGFFRFYRRPGILFGLLREIHSLQQLKIVLKRVVDIFR